MSDRTCAGTTMAALGSLIVALGPLSSAGAQEPNAAQEPDSLEQAAIEWIHLLRDGHFDSAAARVAPELRDRMGAEQLRQLWPQLESQLGALQELGPGTRSETQGYRMVDLAGRFANGAVTVRVVFDADEHVTGFFIQPPAAGGGGETTTWTAPDYVDPGAFRDVEVTVGAPPWELPGTLSLPSAAGRGGSDERGESGGEHAGRGVPGLVLVHGSGPQDRDETIGPNKPFRDLAWGLASRGVAVLRYEKRTRAHGAEMAGGGVDLDAEVIDDALAAADLLRARPEVDPASVFLLGHSLGGTLAPDIARRDGRLAGVVILAGSVRPFRVVVRDQLTYLRGQPENASPEAQARIDALLAVLDRYEAGELDDTVSIMGAPVSYVRELEAVDPVKTLTSLDVPALLLQGGRDYQVTVEDDFEAWRRGLQGRPRTSFRTYPDLSHLFTPGEGMATPTEYMTRPKHVAAKVIQDLATWIRETAS